jgi:hypothetical protein
VIPRRHSAARRSSQTTAGTRSVRRAHEAAAPLRRTPPTGVGSAKPASSPRQKASASMPSRAASQAIKSRKGRTGAGRAASPRRSAS